MADAPLLAVEHVAKRFGATARSTTSR